MTNMEKKTLCTVKYRADDAAKGARFLADSKFVEGFVTAKELEAVERCAEFLTKISAKFTKAYNENEAYNND